MDLGAFSVSLAVEDLELSRQFYVKLGFEVVGGDGENWMILRNGIVALGLFQDMFEDNVLTFNPGWDAMFQELEDFTDIRELQVALKNQGIQLDIELDDAMPGPASIMVTDPDGNRILIDQHR
ncbi:MAG: VOC family protein [Woeseiaceae bacterium]|nr:VOC family protein [Woeseiaceae bacterium]